MSASATPLLGPPPWPPSPRSPCRARWTACRVAAALVEALNTVGRLDRGEGIPALMGFAQNDDKWLSKQAYNTLARSGDPRARQFVRDQIKRMRSELFSLDSIASGAVTAGISDEAYQQMIEGAKRHRAIIGRLPAPPV